MLVPLAVDRERRNEIDPLNEIRHQGMGVETGALMGFGRIIG